MRRLDSLNPATVATFIGANAWGPSPDSQFLYSTASVLELDRRAPRSSTVVQVHCRSKRPDRPTRAFILFGLR